MRKLIFIISLTLVVVSLLGCAKKEDFTPSILEKEGLAPYKLSESDIFLLKCLGIKDSSLLINYNAPKEVTSIYVNVYKLNAILKWEHVDGGGISIGEEKLSTDFLKGVFSMQLKENNSIDFSFNGGNFRSEEIIINTKGMNSYHYFLNSFINIELDKQIPIAIMINTNNPTMPTYNLDDYFNPEIFEGIELVQVVTLEFSNTQLTNK